MNGRSLFANSPIGCKLFYSTALLVIISFCLIGCDGGSNGNGDEPLPKTIAVYKGTGAWDTSAVAIKACLEYGERTVNFVDEHDIQQSLEDYGMIIIGGGNPLDIASALGFTGRQHIISMVNEGGAYIGLGAGAYLAADSMVFRGTAAIEPSIGLYEGLAEGPIITIAPLPNYVLAQVELATEPINPGGVNSLRVLYYGGPAFYINHPSDAISVGAFTITTQHAGFLFQYGFGRVAITSVHPEIEENDPRDGSDFGQNLTDPDSDWQWLLYMVEWAFRERL